MMDAEGTSETSVYFYEFTLCNIPEDSHLQADLYFITYWHSLKVFVGLKLYMSTVTSSAVPRIQMKVERSFLLDNSYSKPVRSSQCLVVIVLATGPKVQGVETRPRTIHVKDNKNP